MLRQCRKRRTLRPHRDRLKTYISALYSHYLRSIYNACTMPVSRTNAHQRGRHTHTHHTTKGQPDAPMHIMPPRQTDTPMPPVPPVRIAYPCTPHTHTEQLHALYAGTTPKNNRVLCFSRAHPQHPPPHRDDRSGRTWHPAGGFIYPTLGTILQVFCAT